MSGPAEVRSTAAVEAFVGELANYRQRSGDALDGLLGQMRRLIEWLEHDRPAYWKGQIRLAETAWHEAKHRLQHCLTTPFVAGERPACQEEKDAVAAAGRRLALCRDKLAAVRHWQQKMDHELFEYQGRVGGLQQMLDGDLVRAQNALHQIVIRLERYAIERPLPASPTSAASRESPPDATSDRARPSQEES